jgi:hypothetical protein
MTEDDYLPPSTTSVSLSAGTVAGLAGLLIGCTLIVSACVLMVFNVLLFSRGFGGVPIGLAQFGGVIGVPSVALIGVLAVGFGFKSWGSVRSGESGVLGAAATAASGAGLVAWLVAGINLLIILFSAR